GSVIVIVGCYLFSRLKSVSVKEKPHDESGQRVNKDFLTHGHGLMHTHNKDGVRKGGYPSDDFDSWKTGQPFCAGGRVG
ncbi:hypothetical protein SB767_35540, partial [Bacillus sp. SIMBA_069]